ncbi:hypothetical protein E2C01_088076 [Portunus trituberculatus]|uniref:Uncharacterized protein n=1 Tax=Portunus trituberculatus TaxID=210409 RepID=A0A5B7J560_PORTR|nr:hypothetical protein [Portunus trituberculatus]
MKIESRQLESDDVEVDWLCRDPSNGSQHCRRTASQTKASGMPGEAELSTNKSYSVRWLLFVLRDLWEQCDLHVDEISCFQYVLELFFFYGKAYSACTHT